MTRRVLFKRWNVRSLLRFTFSFTSSLCLSPFSLSYYHLKYCLQSTNLFIHLLEKQIHIWRESHNCAHFSEVINIIFTICRFPPKHQEVCISSLKGVSMRGVSTLLSTSNLQISPFHTIIIYTFSQSFTSFYT